MECQKTTLSVLVSHESDLIRAQELERERELQIALDSINVPPGRYGWPVQRMRKHATSIRISVVFYFESSGLAGVDRGLCHVREPAPIVGSQSMLRIL